MAKGTTHVIRGELNWAKVLGSPVLNTFTEEREWSVDVTPDKAGRAELKTLGASDKLREPKETDSRTESFLTFRQREYRDTPEGDRIANQPPRVIDVEGKDWPTNKLIGNGSVADVKFTLRDNGKGRPKGLYVQAVRVLKHVSYEVEEFAPLSTDDEFFAEPQKEAANTALTPAPEKQTKVLKQPVRNNPDDLDDDIPF